MTGLGWTGIADGKHYDELRREAMDTLLSGLLDGVKLGRIVNEICGISALWGYTRAVEDLEREVAARAEDRND